ncbi:hypothetical protein Q3G72_020680 [Acer saccharum]|nr:hypothetical protein Q3G72_004140 [Acer saccharum]KAK1583062.1 hypothetical protein Q3G72_020680 [Acer saccharum]
MAGFQQQVKRTTISFPEIVVIQETSSLSRRRQGGHWQFDNGDVVMVDIGDNVRGNNGSWTVASLPDIATIQATSWWIAAQLSGHF